MPDTRGSVENIGRLEHEGVEATEDQALDDMDYHSDQSGSSADEIEASDADEVETDEIRGNSGLPELPQVDQVRHRVVRVAAPSGRIRNCANLASEFGKFSSNNPEGSVETIGVNVSNPQVTVKKTD